MYLLLLIIIIIIIILCLCNNKSHFSNQSLYDRVPKVIMQTGKTLKDKDLRSPKWETMNPEFKYEYYSDDDCRAFIQKHFGKRVLDSFNTLRYGAFKGDLFRYCYLYIKGGTYADLDSCPKVSLKRILDKNVDFISACNAASGGIYQALMACIPGIKFLKKAIDEIVYNTENRIIFRDENYDNKWDALELYTGPVLLRHAMNNVGKCGLTKNVQGYSVYLYRWDGGGVIDDDIWVKGKPEIIMDGKGSGYRGGEYKSTNVYI